MRSCFTGVVIILFTVNNFPVFAQEVSNGLRRADPIESGNHEKREDWFYRVREGDGVVNHEAARWKTFVLMQQSQLKITDEVPVADWKSCGPVNQGGRMIAHAFDPFNSDILWTGSATGGLWRTTDAGENWEPMSDGIPSLAIGAIGIDPQNNNNMLIATGEGYLLADFSYGVGILKSADGGLTWNTTGLTFDDSLQFASLAIAWDPIETNRVYCATTYGIYNSTDGGNIWTLVLPGTATALIIHPQQPEILFAALQQYDGNEGGIYRSTDHGATWELLTNGLPVTSAFGFTSLTICKNYPDILLAGVAKPYPGIETGTLQGIFKTSDGGDTWIQLPETVDFYCYPDPYGDICQGWYDNIIHIPPSDTNDIFSGGIYLYKSNDGGQTWYYSDNVPGPEGWMHPDHHSFAIDPENESRLYAFNDGGIYRSDNGGVTWVQKNNGLVTMQFYYIASAKTDPALAMGGTQDNGIWYNDAMGVTHEWEQYTYGDGFQCAIDHTDADHMYTTELFQGRMKSTNGGNTFHEINDGITETNYFIVPLIMHPQNSQILFTATNNKIYKTTNSGELWVDMDYVSNIVMFCFDQVNPDMMYACSDPYYNTSKIYLSTDGGITWNGTDEPGNKITDIECDPYVAGALYATCARYTEGMQVWKSIDYGDSWENITGDLPAIPVNTITVDERNTNYLYVGTDLGVFVTTNGGINWTAYNHNFPNVIVKDLHYFAGDTTLRAGTHGRGFWKTSAAKMSIEDTVASFENMISVYPNPVVGEAVISFSLAEACDVQMDVVDQLGQKIISLVDADMPAGSHTIIWNSTNSNGGLVAAGIYYIRFMYCGKGRSVKIVAG